MQPLLKEEWEVTLLSFPASTAARWIPSTPSDLVSHSLRGQADTGFVVACLKIFPSSSHSGAECFFVTLVSCVEATIFWLIDFPFYSVKGWTSTVSS